MSVSSRQVVLLNQMIRHVVLPLLLALALARLLPTEEFTGVLTVREDSALKGKTYSTSCAMQRFERPSTHRN